MPSLTPSQRVFGVGLTPIERAFRPPQGMENDPAYNDYARRKFAAADMEDAQRGEVQAALDEQRAKREQRKSDEQMARAEAAAIDSMRGKSPEEIPNILAQFPELARSRNLGGFTHFAQAVQPSAGQKTLAPSLRNRLKPHERQYFDEHFTQGGDAVSAFDAAQMRGEHENSLADMMQKGVPLDVIEKYRSRPLNPIEREALVQQHAVKATKDDHRTEAMRDAIKAAYESMPVVGDVDPVTNKPFTIDEILQARSEVANKAHRSFYPEKYQQTPVAPQAGVQGKQSGDVDQAAQVGGVATEAASPSGTPQPKKPLTPQEIEKSIQESDEMGLARIGADISYPLQARSKALEKLKASVTPMKNLSIREQREFDKNKKDLIGKVEETIRKDNFVIDTLNPAWTDEKSKLAPLVEEFAKKNNVNIDNLYNSIYKQEKIEVSPEDAKRIRNAQKDVDGKWYANIQDAILGNAAEEKNTRLMRLNGQHQGGGALGAIAATYVSHLLGTNQVTNAGVLRALAQERLNSGGALVPTNKSPTGAIPDAKQASLLDSVYNKFFK